MATSNNTTEIPYGYCQCGCGQETNISTHTKGNIKKGMPQLFLPRHTRRKSLEERIWSKASNRSLPDACWEWRGSRDKNGYGRVAVNSKRFLVHRVTWELTYGKIPDGLCVLHNCPTGDNPSCCNPKHLFLGTKADNMKDMVNKGRCIEGEKSPNAKLSVLKVKHIRSFDTMNEIIAKRLAKEYNVCPRTIYSVFWYKTWKRVT